MSKLKKLEFSSVGEDSEKHYSIYEKLYEDYVDYCKKKNMSYPSDKNQWVKSMLPKVESSIIEIKDELDDYY